MYAFEWLITLEQEVEQIWATRRWTISTWIFAGNRYSVLLFLVLELVPVPNRPVRASWYRLLHASSLTCFTEVLGLHFTERLLVALTIHRCVSALILSDICVLVEYLALACQFISWLPHTKSHNWSTTSLVFTGLRTAALCNRSVCVFLVVAGLSGVSVILNLVSVEVRYLIHRVVDPYVPDIQVIFIKAPVVFSAASPNNICETVSPFTASQHLGWVLPVLRKAQILLTLILDYRCEW